MIENVSTHLTVFLCLCPLPASRKGLRLPLRSALFGKGGRDWRPCKWCFEKVFFYQFTLFGFKNAKFKILKKIRVLRVFFELKDR